MDNFNDYGCDTQHQIEGIFASIFVLQNRLQTACEKVQTQITMKQWLLIAMAMTCTPPRTLTSVGNMMGCSRQNVKKLASSLEKKGFINLKAGSNNSVTIEPTPKIKEYMGEIGEHQVKTIELLFKDFNDKEIEQLFSLYTKLYDGIERVENYVKEL